MIHLFRKIRQEHITKNRLRKYLMYAFGEIILVMVGILLALQFNNWNQEKENTKKENWYLINIVEDIEYQKSSIKYIKNNCLKSIEIGQSIMKAYKTNKTFLEVDSLDKKLNFLMRSFTFPNINNTYSELVSSGKFDLIQEKELSLNIIDYFIYIEENHTNTKTAIINVFYPEIYHVYNQFSQAVPYDKNMNTTNQYILEEDSDITKYINNLLEKPASKLLLMNAIRTQISILMNNVAVIDETLELSKELIQLIDNYLGLTSEMVNHYD
ncbi:hypothetical protein ATE90_1505 [Polaribacter sp. Hel1_33_96]|uniref:hypothetical protein n=1 Tax=Polaribacter sp. Hel1_33_96 TaxID=1336805 RepID=UPI000C708F26|nr:hypothetical protein [Polaribacter sp. Hel1_33_96]PKV65093.1 hypothetical protein ATE90_1505 [Polaribacter sp. Hel1_33_96]